MVRIVILSDIHGNLPALEAAAADLARLAPDQVIVNGDVINRGPQSKACIEAVRAASWPVVFGNHEDYALRRLDGRVPEKWLDDFWSPFQRVAEELSAEEVSYLRALPHAYVVSERGLPAIRVVHGSMRALNDGMGFWMDDGELLDAITGAPEPIVIGAHSHRTFQRRVGDRWVLNSGSVGAPFNGDPGAQYLLMTARDGHWDAEFRSVPYDRTPVYEAWAQSGDLERSVAARVFMYEVETATFHLGSYIRFCEMRHLEPNTPASFEAYRHATRHIVRGRSLKGTGEL